MRGGEGALTLTLVVRSGTERDRSVASSKQLEIKLPQREKIDSPSQVPSTPSTTAWPPSCNKTIQKDVSGRKR